MSNLYSVQGSSTPVGTIINSVCPPDNTWLKCDGSILLQNSYPSYVNNAYDLHPMMWKDWTFIDVAQSVAGVIKYAISKIANRIIIVGGNNTVWVSTDKGLTWTTNTGLVTGLYYCLKNNGTRFVTARYNSNKAYHSTDGVTWAEVSLTRIANWRILSYFNNKFVLMPYGLQTGTQTYQFSTDGITWSAVNLPFADATIDVIDNDGTQFVMAVRDANDQYKLYKSTNGQNWTAGTSDFLDGNPDAEADWIDGLIYINSQWILMWEERPFFSVFEGADILNPNDWNRYNIPALSNYDIGYWGFYPYNLGYAIWTGNHYLIPNSTGYNLIVGKELTILNNFPSNVIYDCIMINDGEDYVITVPSNRRSIARSTGTTYDRTTHFQLPYISTIEISGIYNYIKVNE